MKKQQFLGMSLDSGLKVLLNSKHEGKLFGMLLGNYSFAELEFKFGNDRFDISQCVPICRPLSDLTNHITQANYNDGNPFVPILKLYNIDIKDRHLYDEIEMEEELFFHIKDGSLGIKYILKLIEWHFNLMDESEPFIDVNTLEVNPYA